ncbi:uncharacterized protein LOC126976568 [Leptidea sinapis]|uniref:uncharacterized protein LOC126976568 n=1 Tax=Leptidea sinapis TaxID=189913 RepID=UPI0021C37678|nr:uncharacterized protein LOC126976568 [Leptidea sinapis]
MDDLRPILDLPFGDWELFKMLILNLRDLEASLPTSAPTVAVIPEMSGDVETEPVKPRPVIEHQRSRPSNVEKQPYTEYQVTLEEQMICGALQTLNEEAMEDVLHSEPAHPGQECEMSARAVPRGASWAGSVPPSPGPSPRAKGGSLRARRFAHDPPVVTFKVENEEDSDEGHITFSAPARSRRAASRPSSLLLADDAPDLADLSSRSKSVEDSIRNSSPVVDLKLRNLRRTADMIRKVGSAERLSRFKDKILSLNGSRERSPPDDGAALSDDESMPLVTSPAVSAASDLLASSASSAHCRTTLGVECGDRSLQDITASSDFSPRSDLTDLESPRGSTDFDLLPESKHATTPLKPKVGMVREESDGSISNMVEPYNMRLFAHGTSEGLRSLWRQDALDSGPPWPWDEPDSAV